MKINQLFPDLLQPVSAPNLPGPGTAMVVNYQTREVLPTDWIRQLETEVLAIADAVTKVDNADDNSKAVAAQASLARYIRAIQNTEETIKKPLNQLRSNIINLSKTLIERAESSGNRLGKLVADFQYAESMRVAAARRLQDEREASLARDRDEKLLKCRTPEQIEAVNEEMADQLAAEAPRVEPIRAKGQTVTEDWEIIVQDLWLLARSKPSCVKIEPRLSEIKSLLNAGVKVEGVLAKKITRAGVRLGREQPAIAI